MLFESKENNSLAGNTSAMTVEEFYNDKSRASTDFAGYNPAKLSSRNSLFS
jgi:hypothetical protein